MSASMTPSPAERCCGWPLVQGVQAIAFFSILGGSLSLLSLVVVGPPQSTKDRPFFFVLVEFVQQVVHTLALFSGLKGMIGVCIKDPGRIRVLLAYYIVELVVGSVAFVCSMCEVCDLISRYNEKHQNDPDNKSPPMDCATARNFLAVDFVLHTGIFLYFTYIIWSFLVRLVAGEYPPPPDIHLLETELTSSAFMDNSVPQIYAQQQGLLAGNAGRQGRGGSQAYAGEPRRLSGAAAHLPITPFSGTPHRLE